VSSAFSRLNPLVARVLGKRQGCYSVCSGEVTTRSSADRSRHAYGERVAYERRCQRRSPRCGCSWGNLAGEACVQTRRQSSSEEVATHPQWAPRSSVPQSASMWAWRARSSVQRCPGATRPAEVTMHAAAGLNGEPRYPSIIHARRQHDDPACYRQHADPDAEFMIEKRCSSACSLHGRRARIGDGYDLARVVHRRRAACRPDPPVAGTRASRTTPASPPSIACLTRMVLYASSSSGALSRPPVVGRRRRSCMWDDIQVRDLHARNDLVERSLQLSHDVSQPHRVQWGVARNAAHTSTMKLSTKTRHKDNGQLSCHGRRP
jgi:hypothetical protein